jgi:uncharacterized protein
MADLPAIAAAFGHALHAAGVPVTPERSARFATAVTLAEPQTIEELYWIGRVTLLTSHEQVTVYEGVFQHIFRGLVDFADFRGDSANPPPPGSTPAGDRSPGDSRTRDGESSSNPRGTSATPGERKNDQEEDDEEQESVLAAMSEEERLGERPFSDLTPAERELIAEIVARMKVVPPSRQARRSKRHASGRDLDVRATLRRAHRTAGDPVKLVRRKRSERPRRVVLLADVSGSMEPYARVYLHLMRGAVQALGSEAFVFATRLTRLSRPLKISHPDVAYRKAVASAPDWSGGTRIGQAIRDFTETWGRRGMARGAVIVIVSDGWETGDTAELATAMERLSRLAYRIIWVNPRKAATGYEPLVGGMAAALPYVDTFVSGHSLRALEDVMDAIRDCAVIRAA